MECKIFAQLGLIAAGLLVNQLANASSQGLEVQVVEGCKALQELWREVENSERYNNAQNEYTSGILAAAVERFGTDKVGDILLDYANPEETVTLLGDAVAHLKQSEKEADGAGLLRKVESIFDAKVDALSNTVISEVNRSAQDTAKRMGELVSEVQSLSAALTSLQNLSAQREKKLQALEERISCLEKFVVDAASCVKEQVVCNGEPRKGGAFVFRTEFEKERGSLQQRISCLEKFVVDIAGYIANQQSEIE